MLRHRPSPSMAVALLALLVAVAGTAFAAGEGSPILGGERNPGSTGSYTKETQVIADTSGYGTRQSNKSKGGGGAIYGCRSGSGGTPAKNEPCIRANNLSSGLAFELVTGGEVAGRIETATGAGRPFTTNATAVATGLNADRLDDKEAADFLGKGEQAVSAKAADSAKALDSYTVAPMRRVEATAGATLSAAASAAPEVPIAAKGQLTVYGKCFRNATITLAEAFIRTSANGAVLDSEDGATLDGDGQPFLDTTTNEMARFIASVAGELVPPHAQLESNRGFAAIAPDGTTMFGEIDLAVRMSEQPAGGAWGPVGDACWIGGTVVTGP